MEVTIELVLVVASGVVEVIAAEKGCVSEHGDDCSYDSNNDCGGGVYFIFLYSYSQETFLNLFPV